MVVEIEAADGHHQDAAEFAHLGGRDIKPTWPAGFSLLVDAVHDQQESGRSGRRLVPAPKSFHPTPARRLAPAVTGLLDQLGDEQAVQVMAEEIGLDLRCADQERQPRRREPGLREQPGLPDPFTAKDRHNPSVRCLG